LKGSVGKILNNVFDVEACWQQSKMDVGCKAMSSYAVLTRHHLHNGANKPALNSPLGTDKQCSSSVINDSPLQAQFVDQRGEGSENECSKVTVAS
jgi:hypothetical protein